MKPRHSPEWVLRDLPALNASRVLSKGQVLVVAASLAALAAALAWRPGPVFMALNVAVITLYVAFSLYKIVLQFLSVHAPPADAMPAGYAPAAWPVYTVLVPIYRERNVVPGLMAHLRRMDYPADRLQVLLLVEADDADTIEACRAVGVTAPFELVEVPPSFPRTKPKACNYGLKRARGEYLVIFDAEDRPEPDQLRKALHAFDRLGPDTVCLQARLNYYNRDRNLLTRLFTAEYSCWFDLCLPALFRLGAPIPLGGTSNHFRTAALQAARGWDPFNVAEDCDLGIRFYIEGRQVACLDSTTWEEAVSRPGPWIRQRSRWIKGYIQTYFVHLRNQRALARNAGPEGVLHFHLLFGATCFCLLLNPVYWVLTALWMATRSPWLTSLYPLWVLVPALLCLLLGNAAFVLASMVACLNRGYAGLVPYCLLTPLYWVLMSIGAWKGALQLVTRPFHWEKTPHAADGAGEAPR